MSKYCEKAMEYHGKGYNCAQAVLCAFADKTDTDFEVLYKMSEGLGAGMGNRKNTCGALSGAVMLAGLVVSGGTGKETTKAETYKVVSKLADEFEMRCGAFVCEEIKGLKNSQPTVSCDECIKCAVESAERILFGQQL